MTTSANDAVLSAIRSALTKEQVIDLNSRAPLDGGVKIACEIFLGVRPGCEPALDAAKGVIAAAIASDYAR